MKLQNRKQRKAAAGKQQSRASGCFSDTCAISYKQVWWVFFCLFLLCFFNSDKMEENRKQNKVKREENIAAKCARTVLLPNTPCWNTTSFSKYLLFRANSESILAPKYTHFTEEKPKEQNTTQHTCRGVRKRTQVPQLPTHYGNPLP